MGKILSKLGRSNNNNATTNASSSTAPAPVKEEKKSEEKEQTISEKADTMQEVLPSIFMGSYAAAKSKEFLQRHKITHILAIGWDLKAYFPDDFEYLILSQVEDNPSYTILKHFDQAFKFMDTCLRPDTISSDSDPNIVSDSSGADLNPNNNNSSPKEPGRLLVHCHKGLSRSASIIMGYEMSRKNKTFKQVLDEIRETRSFIMPNIGFQAQLQVYEEKKYSLNMGDYDDMDVMERISGIIPGMFDSIEKYYKLFESGDEDKVDGQELFGLTMYFHQLYMLHKERQLNEKDEKYLNDAINKLYNIQKEFIQIESSIVRFEKLFKLGKYAKNDKNKKKKSKNNDNNNNNNNVEKKDNNNDNNSDNNKEKEHVEFEPPPSDPDDRRESSVKAMDTALLAAEHSAAEDDSDDDGNYKMDPETDKNTGKNRSVKDTNDTIAETEDNNETETFLSDGNVENLQKLGSVATTDDNVDEEATNEQNDTTAENTGDPPATTETATDANDQYVE